MCSGKKWWVVPVVGVCLAGGLCFYLGSPERRLLRSKPIRVGILHSLSGTMAISETPVVDATLMAIAEINRGGGLLGRPVEAVIADGMSDWTTFAREAERLITQERVAVVFGCWTSASRKTVRPIFESHDHLLFYPVQYEGLEDSPCIVYTGAAPNQQIIPAVKWCFNNVGKRFFLVGSDYVFPRTANAIIREQVRALKGDIVGEEYLLLGSTDARPIVEKIVAAQPDVILNTINGDSNVAFFRELRLAGVAPADHPTMSFSIAEQELLGLDLANMVGDYACWNYFQSVDTPENRRVVEAFRRECGADSVVDDPMEAAYFGVHLWAQAVRDARTENTAAVRKAIRDQTFAAPEGIVTIDAENLHTWKTVRIGQIKSDGQFDIVWTSEKPVKPVPYPVYRSRDEWRQFLEELQDGWGGQWANTGNVPHEESVGL